MNIINANNSPTMVEQYTNLKHSKYPLFITQVPKEVDDFVMQKDKLRTQKFHLSIAVLSTFVASLFTEFGVAKTKKNIQNTQELTKKIKYLRKMHIVAPIIFGIGTFFNYNETQAKKNAGIISKEQIYKEQDINVTCPTKSKILNNKK